MSKTSKPPSRDPTQPPSVKDVAAAAGVSLGTVSNVLNRPDRVAVPTRARVEAAMGRLGFVRNESARTLRAGRSATIGYIMLDARNPFFTDVAKGIDHAAVNADLSLYLCDSDTRPDREAAYLSRLVEQRAGGILITPIDPHSPTLLAAKQHGTPVVIVDRTVPGDDFCTVAVDDMLGGQLAVEHLLDRGHRRIALVGGPLDIGQVADRFAGAAMAFAAAGGDPDDLVAVPTAALGVADGRTAGQRLAGLAARRRPTAAFCANDLLALGLLQHAIGTGVAVPDQLAIVGYDDIEFAGAAAVPLTSVRQPREELGRRACELVIDEADSPEHRHEQVVFEPELIARASTASVS